MRQAEKSETGAKHSKNCFSKDVSKRQLRDETESKKECKVQTEGKGQFDGEDMDDAEIDAATEELKKSTLSGDAEAASTKALDSDKLDQGNVEGNEGVKESKTSTPADEIEVDTQKLDEVVYTISMDVFPESTICRK